MKDANRKAMFAKKSTVSITPDEIERRQNELAESWKKFHTANRKTMEKYPTPPKDNRCDLCNAKAKYSFDDDEYGVETRRCGNHAKGIGNFVRRVKL